MKMRPIDGQKCPPAVVDQLNEDNSRALDILKATSENCTCMLGDVEKDTSAVSEN